MKKMMYFAAALLVLVGCNKKDNSIENTPKEVVTIKGSIELPQTPHKIAAPTGWESAEGEFGMRWEENDQIYIYNGAGESSLFTIASGAGDSEASFNGSPLSNMDSYSVAYGYDPSHDYKGKATYPTYPVPYVEGNYRPFAEGLGAADGFTIENFGPVIGLQLKGDGAFSKIEVALLNNSKATLATYTMPFEDALTLSAESVTKVYIPIQAKEGAVKIAISFYKEGTPDDVLMLTKTTNMPSANKVTTFPVLTFQGAYEYVDLGLSVKWASMNVGATAPEGYGDYFAWGATETYYTGLNADQTGISWKEGKEKGYHSKTYCGTDDLTLVEWDPAPYDNNGVLKPEYDAAHVIWGGNWRMPTKEEFAELIDNCTLQWTDNYNNTGVKGRILTSKKDGYKDKSLFFPAASYYGYNLSPVHLGQYCIFWTSTHDENKASGAYSPSFWNTNWGWGGNVRWDGRSVRPVVD